MNLADRTFELKEIETLRGHTDRVWCIAWNPASGVNRVPAMIASCGADKKVIIWEQDRATGSFQCKHVLDLHASTVRWCAWERSGNLLATSSLDGDIRIWENVTGRFKFTHGLKNHYNAPVNISWNASGMMLATCIPRQPIWIWQVAFTLSFIDLSMVAASAGHVKMIQWHPLKDILFSCGFDNTIKIWVSDLRMIHWECVQSLGESHSGGIHTIQALAFNAKADKIVACSDDLSITIWSIDVEMIRYGERNAAGTLLCTLTGYHNKTIFSVNWSRKEIICSGAADGALCFFVENDDGLFDGPTYKLLLMKDHAHDKEVNSVQWCPKDSKRLASASDDGTIKIWELASLPPL
ncbi:protein CIA1-like isoform X1 [Primulina huaijiensis]|uniref:protein CIA1-like isoform X1 n=1 Tax=Primulina huaijiensis TaxID=1492673 RepID=UPI003CC70367